MNEEIINAMKAVIDGTTPTAGEWMSDEITAVVDNETMYKKVIDSLQKDNRELSIKVQTLNGIIDKFIGKNCCD